MVLCEEWETKFKSVETNLGTTAAKFDAGLASLCCVAAAPATTTTTTTTTTTCSGEWGYYEGVPSSSAWE
jgi:hypothetical protein